MSLLRVLCVSALILFLIPKPPPQIPARRLQSPPRLHRPNPHLQHHQRHPQIVSRRPQCVFRRRHTLPVSLHQNPHRPFRKLLIRQHHVDHQVFIHMPQLRHHCCTPHLHHHLFRVPRLHPRRPRPPLRLHLPHNHNRHH